MNIRISAQIGIIDPFFSILKLSKLMVEFKERVATTEQRNDRHLLLLPFTAYYK